jgi:hypothetical protein
MGRNSRALGCQRAGRWGPGASFAALDAMADGARKYGQKSSRCWDGRVHLPGLFAKTQRSSHTSDRFGSQAASVIGTFSVFHQVITPPHPPLKIPPKVLPPHGHGSDQHLPNTSQQARAQAPVGVPIGQVRGVQSPQPAPGRSCGTTAPAGGREP